MEKALSREEREFANASQERLSEQREKREIAYPAKRGLAAQEKDALERAKRRQLSNADQERLQSKRVR